MDAPWLWLTLLMVGLPSCVYLPTHLVLLRPFPQREPPRRGDDAGTAGEGPQTPAQPAGSR